MAASSGSVGCLACRGVGDERADAAVAERRSPASALVVGDASGGWTSAGRGATAVGTEGSGGRSSVGRAAGVNEADEMGDGVAVGDAGASPPCGGNAGPFGDGCSACPR